MTTFKILGHN